MNKSHGIHYPMNATKCRNTRHHPMDLHCIHTYSHHRTIMEVLRYQEPLHYCISCLHMRHHIVRKFFPESLKTNRVVTLNYMSTTSYTSSLLYFSHDFTSTKTFPSINVSEVEMKCPRSDTITQGKYTTAVVE